MRFLHCLTVSLVVLVAGLRGQDGVRLDLKLVGGTVIDGRRPGSDPVARRADVGIRGGRVVAIGDLADLAADREIDATGQVVAPGFVDVHAHADTAALRRPEATSFVAMGVTTIVTGNCGSSVADVAEHLAACDAKQLGLNYATLVGHGTVRSAAMGTANRPPSDAELDAMRAHVRRAMAAGAVGMSTGLIYVPGTYADTDELVALSEVVAEFGGLYASHMRDEADHVLDSIREAITIGERAGLRVHLSHLKASGKGNWGRSVEMVDLLEAARARGVPLTGDQYAYTASSTSLDVLFPSDALSRGRRGFCEALDRDESFRAEMHAALLRTMERSGFGDLSYAQIASARGSRELQGLRISEAAERRYGNADLGAQADLAIQVMVASGGSRVGMVYHKMAEPDVERIMALPYVSVAADAGIRVLKTAEKPHPRGCGNNPRVLGRYVRERGALSLELAIHKMTGLPAEVFQLVDRGTLEVGNHADVVVFDPETVLDRATYTEPTELPAGIAWVLVNGIAVIADGEPTGARPGKALRHVKGVGAR